MSDNFPAELAKNAEWRGEYTYPVYCLSIFIMVAILCNKFVKFGP